MQFPEIVSIKCLLKQVYMSHVSKVKGLEDEIDELKKKIIESDRKLNEYKENCKKCIELEEAVKSCQAALHEQSKRFDNLGQKFSVFGSSEKKVSGNFKSGIATEKYNKSLLSKSDCVLQNSVLDSKKSFTKNCQLLKNLISSKSDEQESLELYTEPFVNDHYGDFSSLNQDSLILAPNTIDIAEVNPKQNDVENILEPDFLRSNISSKNCLPDLSTNFHESKVTIGEEKLSVKKRILSDSPNKKNKKSCTVSKSITTTAQSDAENICNSVKSNTADNSEELSSKACDQEASNETEVTKSKKKSPKLFEKCFPKSNVNKQNSVSPSLIQVKNNDDIVKFAPNFTDEDDDFQLSIDGKKSEECESMWTKCDKKKMNKKMLIPKPVKFTTKFKLSLHAHPANYKKQTLKQTKLSKTIFQSKPKVSAVQNYSDADTSLNNASIVASEFDDVQVVTPTLSKTNNTDIDATCMPENCQYEVVSLGTPKTPLRNVSKSNIEKGILFISDFSEDSCDNIENSPGRFLPVKSVTPLLKDDRKDVAKQKNTLQEANQLENLNSFDRLPKKEEPAYKYKEETLRKKSERMQLDGYDCKECMQYYNELGLSENEKQQRLQKCSRHRSKFAPPPTPKHFWEMEFPDTPECKARGYLNETQKVKLKCHRRRPL